MIVCWSAKGGSGATVVACALALARSATTSTTLVDLAGDVPTTLGVPEPVGPGIAEWWSSSVVGLDALRRLRTPVTDRLHLVARGSGPIGSTTADALDVTAVEAIARLDDHVVVDAGTGVPWPALTSAADQRLLVTRACYVGLHRAVRQGPQPSGIVLVREPERALQQRDLAAAIGAPIQAVVPLDPAVSRAVDAGLLATRAPRSLLRAMRPLL